MVTPETEIQGMGTLLDISQSFHEYRDLDDLIAYALSRVAKATGAEMASIILHDAERDDFVFYSSTDTPERRESLMEIRFATDQGIAGSVFRSGIGEVIPDVASDPRHFRSADQSTGLETQSMVVVPLKTTKRTIGVVEALNKREGVFDQQDLDLLTTLSPVIGLAIENARIHTELETAYRELQVIDLGKDDRIRQNEEELTLLRQQIERSNRFDKIIGRSKEMLEVLTSCERATRSDITVLIEGETGTGKELIASAIHYNSARKDKPFVAQNCSGIPDDLLESELFGHRKGAFTGAVRDQKGIFEVADGGTVFLDEVAEMSQVMQPKLLRALQDGDIRPLGSERNRQVNVRLISATNKSLEAEVDGGRFREDLYYRIDVFRIPVPPLRRRTGDIPILAKHFLERFADRAGKTVIGFTRDAMAYLVAYSFPGNVRELENEIERAVAMLGGEERIDVPHLSDRIRLRATAGPDVNRDGTLKEMVESIERTEILKALEAHQGNRTRAAADLGLSRNGLLKKVARYGLN